MPNNYYPVLVWKIDLVLCVVLLILIFAVICYSLLRDYADKLRRRRLFKIKQNIFGLLSSGDGKSVCPPVSSNMTAQQFIDAVTNRNISGAFFNDSEQAYLKDCFINQENLTRLERVARKSWSKWRMIEAILALGYAKASSALPIFEKGLFSGNPDVSYFSMLALGQLKTDLSAKILVAFLRKNPGSGQNIAAILEGFKGAAADEVVKLIRDPEPEVRLWGAEILKLFASKKYLEDVRLLTLDKSLNVRAAACECLGKIGGSEAESILLGFLKDGSWMVRAGAVRGLVYAAGDGGLKHIVGLLKDNSWNVVQTVKGILISKSEPALPLLEDIIMGDDLLASRLSIEILASTGRIDKLLKEIATKDLQHASKEMRLLKGIIKSGAHSCIEDFLSKLSADERASLSDKIKKVDENGVVKGI